VPNWLRNAVTGVVTCVWAANFTAPVFVDSYEPSPELNVAFMAVLGVLLATKNGGGPSGGSLDENRGG